MESTTSYGDPTPVLESKSSLTTWKTNRPRIVASIEEPKAIRAILAHFAKHGALEPAHYRPAARAPPAVAA